MLNLRTSNRFKKDLQKMISQGKSYEKFRNVLEMLLNQRMLPVRHRDHSLIGNWKNRRELHIEPDWLLVYKIEEDTLILERTGPHATLFK
jgi:mRNA interferase YafQ